MNKTIVGIDYSLTSPAICCYDGNNQFSFSNCEVYYLAAKKKDEGTFINMYGTPYPDWTQHEDRYNQIANWALEIVTEKWTPDVIVIEGYAFAAKGKVFNLAENTGLLKHGLFKRDMKFDIIQPTTLKKFATGKGNANKQAMNDAFKEETDWDLKLFFEQPESGWAPSSDIIDAYFLCKYGVCNS